MLGIAGVGAFFGGRQGSRMGHERSALGMFAHFDVRSIVFLSSRGAFECIFEYQERICDDACVG
jgi:hypothetical protein